MTRRAPGRTREQLEEYRRKRDFGKTTEPSGDVESARKPSKLVFVIQKHAASHLHYDLRLELDGVMRSWAVPKGPSLDPDDKRLAVAVPDHSLNYFKFEGTLEEGTYGAGEVRIWDSGKYETLVDPQIQYDNGRIEFSFLGKKVRGEFILIRMSGPKSAGGKNWLLIKRDDQFADIDWQLKTILPPK